MPRGVLPVPRPSARTVPAWVELDLEGAYAEALATADDAAAAATQPLSQYERDPEGFCVDVLGIPRHTIRWSLVPGYDRHSWDGTPDPLAAVLQALAQWEHVAVESATGVGKSFLGAAITLWFLASWRGARVFTFAPKEDQLRLYIWAEIGKMWPRFVAHFPNAELQDLRLYMDAKAPDREAWSAVGYAVAVRAGETVATKAAGMHAEHMLLITEETPGISQAVLEAHENTCTADHNLRLALGNVDAKTDSLHQLAIRPDFRGIRISAYDHPNVVADDSSLIPGAVSRRSIASRKAKYGEESRLYRSRVRGIAPDEAEDALIKLEWLQAAAERTSRWREQVGDVMATWPAAYGVDVANSENGDHAAVARWRGAWLESLRAFPCPNANDLGTKVWTQAQADGVRPLHIGVDGIGVGAGTVNEMNRLVAQRAEGGAVVALHSGGAPMRRVAKGDKTAEWETDANLFRNLRAQMYWQLREDARVGRIALPNDPELFEELTAVQYEIKNGKVQIEDKEVIRKKLGRSPNKADAVVYGNWVRPRTTPPQVTLPPNADDHHLGLVRTASGVRPKTLKEAIAEHHPGRGRPAPTARPWDTWGGR